MNKVEYKNWRTVQIAASILYKYYKNVTITQYSSSLFDLIVQDQETGLSFAVKVKNSKFEESNSYQSYIDEILKLQQNDGNAHVPLLLMLVNEVPEDDYPEDELDKYIKKQFVKSIQIRNLRVVQ